MPVIIIIVMIIQGPSPAEVISGHVVPGKIRLFSIIFLIQA